MVGQPEYQRCDKNTWEGAIMDSALKTFSPMSKIMVLLTLSGDKMEDFIGSQMIAVLHVY